MEPLLTQSEYRFLSEDPYAGRQVEGKGEEEGPK